MTLHIQELIELAGNQTNNYDICEFADNGCLGSRESKTFNYFCDGNYSICPSYREKMENTQ